MERVEVFLQNYFEARTEMQRALGGLYEPLAARFHARNYTPFDQEGSLASSQAERVVSVVTSGATSEAITSGSLGSDHRLRYRLSASGDSWRITSIEIECGVCHGPGKRQSTQQDCRVCKGAGWRLLGKIRDT